MTSHNRLQSQLSSHNSTNTKAPLRIVLLRFEFRCFSNYIHTLLRDRKYSRIIGTAAGTLGQTRERAVGGFFADHATL